MQGIPLLWRNCASVWRLTNYSTPCRTATTKRRLTRRYSNTACTSTTSTTPARPCKDLPRTPEKRNSVTCFKCNKKGHYAQEYPEENFTVKENTEMDQSYKQVGKLNGGPKTEMRIDTGCCRTCAFGPRSTVEADDRATNDSRRAAWSSALPEDEKEKPLQ